MLPSAGASSRVAGGRGGAERCTARRLGGACITRRVHPIHDQVHLFLLQNAVVRGQGCGRMGERWPRAIALCERCIRVFTPRVCSDGTFVLLRTWLGYLLLLQCNMHKARDVNGPTQSLLLQSIMGGCIECEASRLSRTMLLLFLLPPPPLPTYIARKHRNLRPPQLPTNNAVRTLSRWIKHAKHDDEPRSGERRRPRR